MAAYLDCFGELAVSLEAVGEQANETRQLVTLPGSLPSEHDVLVSIVKNAPNPLLLDVKEKLMKEYERSKTKASTEAAFKTRVVSTYGRGQQKRNGGKKQTIGDSSGKCFECNKRGHMAADCKSKKQRSSMKLAFANTSDSHDGWLLDSGASAHMTPRSEDFRPLCPLADSVKMVVANGESLRAEGASDVVVAHADGRHAMTRTCCSSQASSVVSSPSPRSRAKPCQESLDSLSAW